MIFGRRYHQHERPADPLAELRAGLRHALRRHGRRCARARRTTRYDIQIAIHPRPFVTHHVHKLIPHPANSSFVSDHSILQFFCCLDHVVTKKQMEKHHFYMGRHFGPFTYLRRRSLSSRCTWRHGDCRSYRMLYYIRFS